MKSILCSITTVFVFSYTLAQQDIRILADNVELVSGAATFDIGNAYPEYPASYFFLIENVGDNDLTLDGTTPISISGTHPESFVTSVDLAGQVIAAGGFLTFDINVNATTSGFKSIIVAINSDDPDEASYSFIVTATVLAAPADCAVLSGNIENTYSGAYFQGFLAPTGTTEYQAPAGWSAGFNSILGALFGGEVNVGITGDARSGSNALELFSDGTAAGDALTSFKCDESMTSLKGYYKFSGAATDQAMIIVSTGGSNNTTDANSDTLQITTDATAYTLFEMDVPRDENSVDSVLVYLAITNNAGGVSFKVDDLELTVESIVPMNVISSVPKNFTENANVQQIRFNLSASPSAASIDNEVIKVFDENMRRIPGAITTGPSEIYFTPTNPFKKGQKIKAIVPKGSNLRGTSGEVLAKGFQVEMQNIPESPPSFPVAFGKVVLATNSTGNPFLKVVALDIDADNDLDLVAKRDGALVWLENDGSNVFSEHLIGNPGGQTIFQAADLDEDGDLDLIDFNTTDGTLVWYENMSLVSWSKHLINVTVSQYKIADVDGDGDFDITGECGNVLCWLKNNGSQSFTQVDLTATIDVLTYDVGDLDQDGDMDFFLVQFNSTHSILRNNGSEVFAGDFVTVAQAGQGYSNAEIHDFDNDGDGDLMVRLGSDLRIYKNTGTMFPFEVLIGGVAPVLGLQSIFPSGRADIITNSSLISNNGAFSFQKGEVAYSLSNAFPIDFDNDEDLDLVGGGGNEIRLYLAAAKPGVSLLNPIEDLGNHSVKLTWTPAQPVDGTFPITSYKILHQWNVNGVPEDEELTSTEPMLTVNNLLPGTSHLFKISSINAVGESGYPAFGESINFPQGEQVITFEAIPDKFVSDASFNLNVSVNSGLPITFETTGPITLTGTTVTITGIGTAEITAKQGGTSNYQAAVPVTRSFNITKMGQTISFDEIADQTFTSGMTILFAASASSGLAITYTVTGPNASIIGNVATFNAPGEYTVSASQAGNNNFDAAATVSHTFCLNPGKPSITMQGANTESATLLSSYPGVNQWYLNGAPINGATAATLNITEFGIYQVAATAETCASELSNNFSVIITSTEDLFQPVSLSPNPVSETATLRGIAGPIQSIHVVDATGRRVETRFHTMGQHTSVDLSSISAGGHVMMIANDHNVYRIRFIKR